MEILDGISTAARAVCYAVQGAGLLAGMVRRAVRDLIAQSVATLAARLPQWWAADGVNLGLATPVVVEQVSALVSTSMDKVQRVVRALLASMRRLQQMFHRLGELFTGLGQGARQGGSGRAARTGAGATDWRSG